MTRWLAVSASGDVLRACVADDIGEARTLLRTTLGEHRGSYVQSAISHALRVDPFKQGDRCPGGCGGLARSGGRICVPCRNRDAAKARWHEGRGAQRAYRARGGGGVRTGKGSQRAAQAAIWNGIVRRQAKRGTTQTTQQTTQPEG